MSFLVVNISNKFQYLGQISTIISCTVCAVQRGACMSHVSKKNRLNKPLSIYTPPLLQQRSHQAQSVRQSNRFFTLLLVQTNTNACSSNRFTHFTPLFLLLSLKWDCIRLLFRKVLPVRSGLGRKTRASAAKLSRMPTVARAVCCTTAKFSNRNGYGRRAKYYQAKHGAKELLGICNGKPPWEIKN